MAQAVRARPFAILWLSPLNAGRWLLLAALLSGAATNAEDNVTLDLPATTLPEALVMLAEQAELSILVARSAAEGHRTKALQGRMSVRKALWHLLNGSGLGYRYIADKTISVSAEFSLPGISDRSRQTSSPQPTPPPSYKMDEITVTSQRISENLQSVPMAVSVLSGDAVARGNFQGMNAIGTRVPGLTVSSFSLGQPTLHMRGIGSNDDGAAMDNSVVVFVDDVYIGRISHIDQNLLDLEQVEVIRGPQGTLYGKNAIGGAIKLVTRRPTENLRALAEISVGNLDHKGLRALLSGPLIGDRLLGRLAVDGHRRDGWQTNLIVPGEKQHDDNRFGIRGTLLFTPDENWEFHWTGDISRENLNSTGRIPVKGREPLRLVNDNGDPIPLLDDSGNPVTDRAGNIQYQSRLPTRIFNDLGGDPRHATNGIRGYTDRSIWGFSQRAVRDLGSGSFFAITGYRESHFDWLEDSTGLPASVTDQIVGDEVRETHRQFSQEFRWNNRINDHSSFLLGLYYLAEYTHRREVFPFVGADAISDQRNQTRSYAIFGEWRHDLSSKTAISLGGRYHYDQKTLKQRALNDGAPAIILENFQLRTEASWRDFSPRLSVTHAAKTDLMFYASLARGMKSGGFQGAPGTRALANRTIDPETAWGLELGMKSQWLDDRMRLNLAAFYTDYRDLQVVQFRTADNFGLFETNNAASATLEGVELEFEIRPTEALTLAGYYAFLDATYDRYRDLEGRDFTGNQLRGAPRHSANIMVDYRRPWLGGTWNARVDYRYQSRSFREPDNRITIQPAFRLVDASLGFTEKKGHWNVRLWAKNLFDEEYITHLFLLGGNDYGLYGTPRTYGLRVSWEI